MTQRMRTALDFGPLVAWLAAYLLSGKNIYFGIWVAIIASVIALGIYYWKTRRVAVIPAVTCFIMVVFGGLTIYFHDDAFVMMKPTLVYLFMGGGLMVSALTGKNVLGEAMGPYVKLPPEAWKIFLTRYALFCFAMAIANEVLRRNLEFDTWLNVKIFGFTIIAFGFMMTQMPLIMKYIEVDDPEGDAEKAALKAESGSAGRPDPDSGTEQTPPHS